MSLCMHAFLDIILEEFKPQFHWQSVFNIAMKYFIHKGANINNDNFSVVAI